MTSTLEPGGVWNEPGGDYFHRSMDDLGITDDQLEKPVNPHMSVPIGDYPNLDRVYAKAWELREADER